MTEGSLVSCTLNGKRLELSTPNLVAGTAHDIRSACVEPEFNRAKVKVTCALPAWVCMSV